MPSLGLRALFSERGATNRKHHDGYIMVADAEDLHHLNRIETYRTTDVAAVPSGRHERHRRQRSRSDRFVSGKARIRTIHAVCHRQPCICDFSTK